MHKALYGILLLALVPLTSCTPLVGEHGTLTLVPSEVATNAIFDTGQDAVCVFGLDRTTVGQTISEDLLNEGEVGAGFFNQYVRINLCGRRQTFNFQGLVRFDPQPLRDLGLTTITRATLHADLRRFGPGTIGTSEGLVQSNCPHPRIPTGPWTAGFHNLGSRSEFTPAVDFPMSGVRDIVGSTPRSFDVTRAFPRSSTRMPAAYELAFQSTSDLIYRDNNEFCLVGIGNMRLEIEYDRLRPAGD